MKTLLAITIALSFICIAADHTAEEPDAPVKAADVSCTKKNCTKIQYKELFTHMVKTNPRKLKELLEVFDKSAPWTKNKKWFDALRDGGFEAENRDRIQRFAAGILYEMAKRVKHETGRNLIVSMDGGELTIQAPTALASDVRKKMNQVLKKYLSDNRLLSDFCSGEAANEIEALFNNGAGN